MKLENAVFCFNYGQNDWSVEDFFAHDRRKIMSAQSTTGRVFTNWPEPKRARLVLAFCTAIQAMCRDESIDVKRIVREMSKIDELACIFSDDIRVLCGLKPATDEQVAAYEKALIKEIKKEAGLK